MSGGSPSSEINLTGNGGSIPDGSTTPDLTNHTDFGSTSVSTGTVVRTFTIQNTGNLPLNLTGTPKVAVSGVHAADFTVTQQPISPVAAGGGTSFQVTFDPSVAWLRTATLSIASDDPDENPYDFAIQGTGTVALAANYATGSEVPLTTGGFTATGNAVNFTLNYAPTTGTELMVVLNTGTGFINGTFDNLAQGQAVSMSYGGITYDFVANYYGGNGNDLVLIWANNRAFAWGYNNNGQLGDNTTINRPVPVPVTNMGVLAGKTLLTISAGSAHSLALCSDGTVATWGYNSFGQLGDNSTMQRNVPVPVNTTAGVSALFGKTVVAISTGDYHSLALCSDGTIAAWGSNSSGQLGDNTATQRNVPVAVNTVSGVSALFGKTVVAIAAGASHSLALCSDGTVAAWGRNGFGAIGDNTTTQRNVPVAVNTASGVSVLFGKTVVSIAAGYYHSLALCSDGTVAVWGYNYYGQLGNNSTTQRNVPVAVNMTSGVSALFGKTVMSITAGRYHSLALCIDGTVTVWGYNTYGQLGDNTTTQRLVPVAVNTASGVSALFGKTVIGISAGFNHSLALCSDGTVTAWGSNATGQLGDTTTSNRSLPVAVNATPLAAGERFTRVMSGSSADLTLALVAVPYASEINLTGNSGSIPDGSTTPSLANHTDFGSTAVGGGTVNRTFTIQNTGNLPLNLTGTPKVAVSGAHAADFTVTSQPVSPVAAGGSTTFQVTFAPSAAWLRNATITIANDDPDEGLHDFAIQGNGATMLNATYVTASDVPLTTNAFTATGCTVNFTLNYAPATGTELMVVRNTGLGFITGTFNNLAQGQRVSLSFGGIAYDFVANYYGGSGNDLVLVWATNRAFAWGSNANGQLGDNSTTQPVLAGKTVLTISAGSAHSLALCSDGTVAAWGSNTYGQLGDNTTTQRLLPVAVNSASGVSALFGKTVIAISAGGWHSMALCSDGTVVAWGYNGSGQIGDNTSGPYGRLVPVAVNSTSGVSALFGKTVVAIGAGVYHSLALCSDGTVASWGHNDFGELGDNTTAYSRSAPVAVNTALSVSALFGKKVVAIATGQLHNLALCSDGTVVAWGSNNDGKLGDNTTTDRRVPVAVNTTSGVSALFGKTVVAIAAGGSHSIALCSDSTVAAWGFNAHGQLGDGTVTVTAPYGQPVPVAVNTALGVSALYDMAVVAISAGSDHSLALCSTGTVVAWGYNGSGQIGDNTTTQRLVPVPVSTTPLAAGERFTRVMSGSSASHTLALVAAPAPEIQIAANSVSIPDGGSQDFGNVAVGSNTSLVFTITNRGAIDLTGLGIMIDGADAAMFTVTANPVAPVSAAGGSTTFTVRFAPTTAGMKTAAIHIANNDPDENPFDIALTGNIGSPLQGWRLTNFGSVDNSGDGADLNDFDKDGIPNLNEFAFGLNPKSSSSGLLPTPQKSGSNLVVSFTEPVGVSGISYGAEWSQTLLAGSWTAVTDTGNTGASPPQHTFSVPIGTKTKLYMRLKVTNPNP